MKSLLVHGHFILQPFIQKGAFTTLSKYKKVIKDIPLKKVQKLLNQRLLIFSFVAVVLQHFMFALANVVSHRKSTPQLLFGKFAGLQGVVFSLKTLGFPQD